MKDQEKPQINNDIISMHEELISWRKELNKMPESSSHELNTTNFLEDKLKSFGMEVDRTSGSAGVVGIMKKGASHRSLALRVAINAYFDGEKLNHKAGHDGDMTILLGIARYMALHKEFDGTLYFIFQSSEDISSELKEASFQKWLLSKYSLDFIFGLHNVPFGIGTIVIEDVDLEGENLEVAQREAKSIARMVVEEDKILHEPKISAYSEDFNSYLSNTPGVFVGIGNGVNFIPHEERYQFNDFIIPLGVQYGVELSEHVLTNWVM
ncbi:M20/M25/M40 family metallo-hydrolase [Aureibacter tunicatorum]|uniref:Metal-dependent amidase/aminoacylase/carboxypeptidase family protein n=1 Tax=Aureibacter tunicatorum TaxID=866807 RepID=A0AAE3XHT3_9BACT|nr:M20/M25/M40 family metallo-hydrolase [Aureibacter tunicatorum]MDR6237108.1 metal-dependent amidase/aminoacylase/carboxypeptidase family protein [Aureibacter tunicatorum]BDD06100.1 hypothetical protein AUTU_35830 [Aureibacter tunicatorum]